MSDINENEDWQDIRPKREVDYFRDWYNLEIFLGRIGEPGFGNVSRLMTFSIENPDTPIMYIFTYYRGEDGSLLGVFVNYIADDILKPFALYTHPDNQRKGIATILADFVIKKYEQDYDKKFSYSKSWGDVVTTESAANWANRYVKNKTKNNI